MRVCKCVCVSIVCVCVHVCVCACVHLFNTAFTKYLKQKKKDLWHFAEMKLKLRVRVGKDEFVCGYVRVHTHFVHWVCHFSLHINLVHE